MKRRYTFPSGHRSFLRRSDIKRSAEERVENEPCAPNEACAREGKEKAGRSLTRDHLHLEGVTFAVTNAPLDQEPSRYSWTQMFPPRQGPWTKAESLLPSDSPKPVFSFFFCSQSPLQPTSVWIGAPTVPAETPKQTGLSRPVSLAFATKTETLGFRRFVLVSSGDRPYRRRVTPIPVFRLLFVSVAVVVLLSLKFSFRVKVLEGGTVERSEGREAIFGCSLEKYRSCLGYWWWVGDRRNKED